MKKTIINCDVCGKEITEGNKMSIPIIRTSGIEANVQCLIWHEMEDVCDDCYNELGNTMFRKYYEMCARHNNSGLRAIGMED